MSRRTRLLLLAAAIAVVLIVFGLLGLYLAARHEPAFYHEALHIDRAVLEKGSDRMLQQTTALASAVKKRGHWEALFTAEQVNGWLAVDLVRNHPNTLPSMLHDPRVAIDPKRVTVACRFERDGLSSVLSLTVEPYLPEPNVVALRIVSARAGLLPVPLGQVLNRISEAARDLHVHLEWRRADGAPVAMFSLPPAAEDRPVRIETLRLGEGEVYVGGTTQTKP
jgi:hypothetical protein